MAAFVERKLHVPGVHSYVSGWTLRVQLIEATHVETTSGGESPKKFWQLALLIVRVIKLLHLQPMTILLILMACLCPLRSTASRRLWSMDYQILLVMRPFFFSHSSWLDCHQGP